jgi:acetyl-CoA acetyltransferase
MSRIAMPPSSREFSRVASIVGVGETDYHADYKAARAKAPGHEAPTVESLMEIAFERALADSGLSRAAIDGLSCSYTYGGPTAADTAQRLALRPRHLIDNFGIFAGPLPVVCAAIAEGRCDTVAMVYAVASRSIGRIFGGQTFEGEGSGAPSSYYYYHPWGWSSQAAHWAMVWSHYQQAFAATEADLGAVAVQLREHARANPNAVMQTPLTIEDYLASRYIVRPLHLFDLCLVNDGAVCLIVRRTDMSKDLAHAPVEVAGWSEAKLKGDKMNVLVRQRLRPQLQAAGADAFAMAGLALSDVRHFEGYDASTMHLISQFEGYGFVEPGAGLDFCKAGEMAVGGRMPVNVNGGMLSGGYMHGWNHVAEITRQLRGEAGPRQIPDLDVSMFSLAETDQVHPLLFTRGG